MIADCIITPPLSRRFYESIAMHQTSPAPWPLAELERLERDEFVARLGGVYEHSPWVAELAHRERPFGDFETLVEKFRHQAAIASIEAKRALVLAHPELGSRRLTSLTLDSQREQRGAGLSEASSAKIERMTELNCAYRERHGFPFIIAVAGLDADRILAEMERRLPRESDQEFAEALTQIDRIARLRLSQLVE